MSTTVVTTKMPPGVLSLAVGAFAIGVTEFIVVGILPAIARDLHISIESAGSLVSLYALALAIGTPLLVIGLSRLPRKLALLGLMTVFLAGNLLAALSHTFELLLVGRVITAVAHGTFFAIGATVAANLVPKAQAGRAISVMFAGLTLAMVIGVPLGSFLGNLMGWRLPFFAVAALAALGLAAMARWLPAGLARGAGGKAATQLAALGSGPILTMMAVTVFGFGGSFAAFTFITPILTDITGFSATMASALLIVFGAATFAGNLGGGYLTSHVGWQKALRLMLLLLAATQVGVALAIGSQWMMVVMLFVWGVFAFGLSPALQAGMLATAERHTPKAVDFASGLNISAFNLGISLGSMLGALMVSRQLMASSPWAGVAASLLALLPLAWLARRRRPAAEETRAAVCER
ncbi:MFS transporter [Janthinobacterium sp. J1-1]|uniref:MFS transporter n=1 Tax=Janthinobacterium sp. J1-1 TaxID=3065910 RepID=UPI0028128BFC|nr:MFS transporter [Janthinobacterium sp. J1-1]